MPKVKKNDKKLALNSPLKPIPTFFFILLFDLSQLMFSSGKFHFLLLGMSTVY